MADIPLTNVSGFGGATKLLYNRFSKAGWTALAIGQESAAMQAVSGAMTANVLVDLINETGAGEISHLSFSTADSTSRTIRIVVTVDGTVVFDYTSAAISSSGQGAYLAGDPITTATMTLPPIKNMSSIRVQYASSLTETGKINTYLAYQKVT